MGAEVVSAAHRVPTQGEGNARGAPSSQHPSPGLSKTAALGWRDAVCQMRSRGPYAPISADTDLQIDPGASLCSREPAA